LIAFTRFLAIPSFLPGGAFKRGAERHAQRDPEADVMEGGSHGNANRHADCDARAGQDGRCDLAVSDLAALRSMSEHPSSQLGGILG
jgi:hypothetical protein